MRIEPEISGASIVLIGSFNPAIFSPAWFLHNSLISEKENDTAQVQIIHPKVCQFETEWFQLLVEAARFSITTQQDPTIRICDLVLRTFDEHLPHTPLTFLGINRHVHFRVASVERRDEIGRRLAPPDAWGEWADKLKFGNPERPNGLKSLTMLQHNSDDRDRGYISATVEPSSIAPGNCGILVKVNDHYELDKSENNAGPLMELLRKNFESSQQRSDWITDQIMALANV